MTRISTLKKIKPEPQALPQKTNVFIAGIGAVGGTLLQQTLNLPSPYSVNVVGICDSKHTVWNKDEDVEISPANLQFGEEKNWGQIINKLQPDKDEKSIFVDATGNREVAELYLKLFAKGIHVVTPSKLANTRKQVYFNLLEKTARKNHVKFLYETNVGAGLPIIQTLQNLINTGDEIVEIEGVLSGTMTYLFSQLDEGHSFSESVIQARQLGYAEPDPRDDLSGEDVARKMMILARICGYDVEREELDVEPITPKTLQKVDSTTFLEKLPEFDAEWKERLDQLNKEGKTLRYIGSLNKDGIQVGLKEVKLSSPFGGLTGTNNIIQIKTNRYFDQPLIIQGPGAGKEVTAAGVLADVLKIVSS